nr:hypothetical protein [uncultured Campylobacter sp.]
MKKIFLFLCAASMLFALSEAQIKDYIAQNSENIGQLQGTPSKIYASSPPLLYMLYALDPAKISGTNFELERLRAALRQKRGARAARRGRLFRSG